MSENKKNGMELGLIPFSNTNGGIAQKIEAKTYKLTGSQTGRHNPTLRCRLQSPPIPIRPRRRYRALPSQGYPPDVKEEDGEAQQDQALHQDHQLQPPHAYPLHARA